MKKSHRDFPMSPCRKKVAFCSVKSQDRKTIPNIPPDTTELDLSQLKIESFEGLPALDSLESMRCTDSRISSFKGARTLPSLKNLYLERTPVEHYIYYRIMALIAFGDSIVSIDHSPVKKSEYSYAKNNRELLYELLREGWVVTMIRPVKLYHVKNRMRRVLYPRPWLICSPTFTQKKNISRYSPDSPKSPSSPSSPVKKYTPYRHEKLDELYLIKRLHSILFKTNVQLELNDVKNIKKILDSNQENASLLINMILRAVNVRPLLIKDIVHFASHFRANDITEHLKGQIPLFNFNSFTILAKLLENLLSQQVLTPEDIQPYFFSVYEQFENWNSTFCLFEGNEHLSIDFITFYSLFSRILEQSDPELYNNLTNQLGDEQRMIIQKYQEIDEKSNEIIHSLITDDPSTFSEFSDEEVNQAIIELTPFSLDSNIKSAAAAFAGANACFEYVKCFTD